MNWIATLGIAGVLALAGALSGAWSASGSPGETKATASAGGDEAETLPAGQTRVVVPVKGMTCGGCEASVKLAVKKLDGIVAVDADHQKGTATVTYEEAKLTVEKIVEAINKTGFKASLPEKKPDAGTR